MNTKEKINGRTAGQVRARGGNVTGDTAASSGGRTHLALLVLLCQAPLCLCFAATAVVLQWAEVMRSKAITDDALLPSLTQYVHPAAFVFLVAGFALSIGITAASIWYVAGGSSRFCEKNSSRLCETEACTCSDGR